MTPKEAPTPEVSAPRKRSRRKRIVRLLLYLLVLVFLGLVIFPAAMAWSMLHPPRRHFKATPADFGLISHDLVVDAQDAVIHGWWIVAPKPTGGTVIVCHGIGDERSTFLPEADEFARAGWDSVLIDLPGHGDSTGRVSMGLNESYDLAVVIQAVVDGHARTPIVLYGFSLGAVAALRAGVGNPHVAGILADSAFCRLDATLGGPALLRAAGPLHDPLFRLVMWYGERLSGLPFDAIRNDEWAANSRGVPLLLIHGAADRVTPPSHSERIRAAASGPVVLWIIPGVGHAETFGAQGYETVLVRFLDAVLKHRDLDEVKRAIADASHRD